MRIAALLLVGCLALAGCSADKPGSDPTPPKIASGTFPACPAATGEPVGDSLPDLRLGCLDGSGTSVRIAAPTGAPRVINLWASWCQPCATELPVFAGLAESTDAVEVLGVVTEDRLSTALRLADDAAVQFPNVFDAAGELRRALGRATLPVTVFVAGDGKLAHVYSGPPLTAETLRDLIDNHLGVSVA